MAGSSWATDAADRLPPNLPALTSVRIVLALGVVFFHYELQWPWRSLEHTGLFDKARLGVDIFFILSGFVLTHAYREAIATKRLDYRRFLVARFARVYPAHVAVLTFVLLMVGAAHLAGADFDREFYSAGGLLSTLLLVHAWSPGWTAGEWNGPSWSLSAEWFAYLAFPLFAWIGLRLRKSPLLLLALTLAVFLGIDQAYQHLYADTVVHAETRLGILRIIPEFLYGIALYRLAERLRPKPAIAIASALVTAGLLIAAMHFKADDRLVVAAAGPLILSLALLSRGNLDRPIARPWMLASGEASYALYLVHMPILIGWKGLVSALTGRPSTYTFAWWEIGVLLAITIASAFALHFAVERPARTWIRRQFDGAGGRDQIRPTPSQSLSLEDLK